MSEVGVLVASLIGLVVGSVVWVMSWSRAHGKALWSGPACAEAVCKAPLGVAAWLPLQGFGLARRCRRCDGLQPWRRIIFEAGVAAYFGLVAAAHDRVDHWLIAAMLFAVPLLMVLLIDAWTRFIYTDLVGLGVLLGLGLAIGDGPRSLLSAGLGMLVAALIFGGFFAVAALLYRNLNVAPFGLGDIYLAAMIGAMVRFPAVMQALFFGILLAGLASVLLLVTGRASRRDPIAYGPYLCLGALITLVP